MLWFLKSEFLETKNVYDYRQGLQDWLTGSSASSCLLVECLPSSGLLEALFVNKAPLGCPVSGRSTWGIWIQEASEL